MEGCFQGCVKEWVLNTFHYFPGSRGGCLRRKLSTRVVKMITEFCQYLIVARHGSLFMFSDSDYSMQLQ